MFSRDRVHHAGGDHRRIVAGAVANDRVRTDLQPAQQRPHRPVRGQHTFHGAIDLPEPPLQFLHGWPLARRYRGARKNEIARQVAARVVHLDPVGQIEAGPHLREVQTEVQQHVRVLRAFAREEERELAPRRFLEEIDALAILDLPALGVREARKRVRKLLRQVLRRTRRRWPGGRTGLRVGCSACKQGP